MKPKPYSLQFRFMLMQAGSVLLALWLVAGALYLSQYIHDQLAASLEDLRAELALNTQIHSSLEELSVSFWRIYSSANDSRQADYYDALRKLPELTSAYARMNIPADEKWQVQELGRMESQLIARTNRLLAQQGRGKTPPGELDEVRRQSQQIRIAVRRIAERQLQRLQDSSDQLHRYTLALLVLLLASAALALAALGSFRHVHRHQLWAPIEELRRMVLEVRRGNLNIQGKIPQSVELGPLTQAFVDMAAELREMRDSLELKVAERTAALQAAQNQLLQAAKHSSLGQLVSGVAHEINNPLTSILGFSEVLLGRNDLGPGADAHIQTIRDEALRLKNLVANLSSFARRGPQQTQRLDLRQLLARLVELRHYQLAANDIQLQFVPPPQPVWVEADADQILQVLFNLTLNSEHAIKACRERGEIRLDCGVQGGRAWFEVADNGSGIPAALRGHIFDPFFTTKPVGQGSGLGLSISHGIVLQHHGEIAVDSVEGKGTQLRVWLPLASGAEATSPKPPAGKSPRVKPAGRSAPRVLVVDDEAGVTSLVSAALENQGFHRTLLNEPLMVEHVLAGTDFDLMICDLKMPKMNGLEILSLVRDKRPRLAHRFLLMTANDADVEKPGPLNGIPILRKPFTLAQLNAATRALLQSPKN